MGPRHPRPRVHVTHHRPAPGRRGPGRNDRRRPRPRGRPGDGRARPAPAATPGLRVPGDPRLERLLLPGRARPGRLSGRRAVLRRRPAQVREVPARGADFRVHPRPRLLRRGDPRLHRPRLRGAPRPPAPGHLRAFDRRPRRRAVGGPPPRRSPGARPERPVAGVPRLDDGPADRGPRRGHARPALPRLGHPLRRRRLLPAGDHRVAPACRWRRRPGLRRRVRSRHGPRNRRRRERPGPSGPRRGFGRPGGTPTRHSARARAHRCAPAGSRRYWRGTPASAAA